MINVEALKNKVLDLAMHGKLVAQDPQDEPASALVEKIKKEKAQLIKDKKIKKAKPLPPIEENEIPYEIPDSWKWVRLGNYANIIRGGSPRPIKQYLTDSSNGINWIKIGDTKKNNKYIVSTLEKINKSGLKKTRYVKKNTLLLTNSMSFGRPYILKIDGAIHDGWLALSEYENYYDQNFLYYLLSSNFIFKQFKKSAKGSTVKNLNKDRVALTMVPLFSLQEQQRIVDKIEEIFAELDKLDEASQKYDECKELLNKRVLDLAMHGKLVAQVPQDEPVSSLVEKIKEEKAQLIKDKKIKKTKALPPIGEDEIPYEIPDSWEWVRLGDIVRFENGDRGKNYPGKKYWIDSGIPFLNSGSLDGMGGIDSKKINYISEERFGLLRSGFIKKNDILYTLRGSVGKVGINNITQGAIASSLVIIRPIGMNPMYLLNVFMSTLNFAFLNKFKNGSAQPNLSVKFLMKFMVPLPPQQEQQRIVDKIEEIFDALKEI